MIRFQSLHYGVHILSDKQPKCAHCGAFMEAVIEPEENRFGWTCLAGCRGIQHADFDFIGAGFPEELFVLSWNRMRWRAKRLGFSSEFGVTEDYRLWRIARDGNSLEEAVEHWTGDHGREKEIWVPVKAPVTVEGRIQ